MNEKTNKNKLSLKDINKAKQNGFILTGITGAGKTTLLNVLLNEEVGTVRKSASSVTKDSTVYYYKDNSGNCFSIIDTPGLADTANDKKVENDHLDSIRKAVKKDNIHIKGILFLINFQKERIDASEQGALINYNQLFPLKRFWKNIIIIYTHYFTCEDGDELEDMKQERSESNKVIFTNIMKVVKGVSDVIKYEDLKILYFNSFWPIKKEKQKKINEKVRSKLDIELIELSKTEALFCKIEFVHINDYHINENGKEYLAEVEFIAFYDLQDNPIKKTTPEIKNKKEINKKLLKEIPKEKIEVDVVNAEKDKDGNLNHVAKKGTEENSNILREYKKEGIGAIIGGVLGVVGGSILFTTAAPVAIAAVGAGGIGALIGKLFN